MTGMFDKIAEITRACIFNTNWFLLFCSFPLYVN